MAFARTGRTARCARSRDPRIASHALCYNLIRHGGFIAHALCPYCGPQTQSLIVKGAGLQ